jgi:preprotein translocase subunit SecE
VLTGSIVVIIACAIVGAYLYGADMVFRPFVERVLLGQ